MQFEPKISSVERAGQAFGFTFSYLLFSTIVFFIFFFPEYNWHMLSYLKALIITLVAMAVGFGIKKTLI